MNNSSNNFNNKNIQSNNIHLQLTDIKQNHEITQSINLNSCDVIESHTKEENQENNLENKPQESIDNKERLNSNTKTLVKKFI